MQYKKLRDRMRNLQRKYPFIAKVNSEKEYDLVVELIHELSYPEDSSNSILLEILCNRIEEWENYMFQDGSLRIRKGYNPEGPLPDDLLPPKRVIDMGFALKCMQAVRDNPDLTNNMIVDILIDKEIEKTMNEIGDEE